MLGEAIERLGDLQCTFKLKTHTEKFVESVLSFKRLVVAVRWCMPFNPSTWETGYLSEFQARPA